MSDPSIILNQAGISLLVATASLSSCSTKKEKQQDEEKRPNIIFIMTDDHASNAVSCYGSNLIQTPHIDRLAKEGIKFENTYAVNALSGPSRACILTGKFSHVNGFKDNHSVFNGDQQTFPKILRENGYQTAMIGKWHLITEPQGFDYWCILSGQHEQGDYYSPDFIENGNYITESGYVTDIITDKVINFIDNRKSDKPFMIMYHQKAPHRNWMPAPRHLGFLMIKRSPNPIICSMITTIEVARQRNRICQLNILLAMTGI